MKLSVVVPFYNVEPYIHECLASIETASLPDLEVVLVDDGSRDGSRAVAERFVARDDRFRIVTQDNQGLGPARNTGMRHALGDYVTFVDSDDVVPRHAWQQMTDRLDDTGSDFATGNALRFNLHGVRTSWLHSQLFSEDLSRTTVRAVPRLANDRMIWNKVYRRSFWERGGYEFPAIMYEDYPVTLRAHLEATSVEVLSAPVYLWRERDGGDSSITQRILELRNVADRVTSAAMVLDLLDWARPAAPDAVRRRVQDHLARTDIGAVARAIAHPADGADADRLLEAGQQLVGGIEPAVVATLPPLQRLRHELIRSGRVPQLAALVDARDGLGPPAGNVRRGLLRRRRLITLPGTNLEAVPEDSRVLAERELDLRAHVLDARWQGHELRLDLETWVYFSGALTRPRLKAWLQRADGSRIGLRLDATPEVHGPALRCTVVVDAEQVLAAGAETDWVVQVELDTGTLTREGMAREAAPGSAAWSAPWLGDDRGVWVQSGLRGGTYTVRAQRPGVQVVAVLPGYDGELALEGTSPEPLGRADGDALLKVRANDDRELFVPLLVESDDPTRWSARLSPGALIDPDLRDPFVDLPTEWALHLVTPTHETEVALRPDVGTVRVLRDGREIEVSGDLFHGARITELDPQCSVEHVDREGPGRLVLRGRLFGGAAARHLLLQWHHRLDNPVEIRAQVVGEGDTFRCALDLADLADAMSEALSAEASEPAESLESVAEPLAGDWNLTLETDDGLLPVHVTGSAARHLPPPEETAWGTAGLSTHRRFALRVHVSGVRLRNA